MFTSILLLSLIVRASEKDDIVRIDCETGHVDPSLAGSTFITDGQCVQFCKSACLNINVESELEGCLSSNDLDPCLFQLSRIHEVGTSSCVTSSMDAAPTLVFTVNAEDLEAIGDGKDVEAVSMLAELADPLNVQKCANHGISLGVSTQSSTDDSSCRFAGAPSFTQTYSIQDIYLITNITELFTAAYQSHRALTLFGTFMDTSCGAPGIKTLDVAFSMKYKDGFRPSPECQVQGNCHDCEAKGCSWCDWSDAVNTLLPSWLPEWDWITEAREDGKGMCGINSAVCGLTAGRVNDCAAAARLLPVLVVSSLTIISMI